MNRKRKHIGEEISNESDLENLLNDTDSNCSSEMNSSCDDSIADENYNPNIDEESSDEDPLPLGQNNLDTDDNNNNHIDETVLWFSVSSRFNPRYTVAVDRIPVILNKNIDRSSNYLDIFMQLFPRSLLIYIAQCTNIRLEMLRKKKKLIIADTDHHEILLLLGVTLVVCYNHVPSFSDY